MSITIYIYTYVYIICILFYRFFLLGGWGEGEARIPPPPCSLQFLIKNKEIASKSSRSSLLQFPDNFFFQNDDDLPDIPTRNPRQSCLRKRLWWERPLRNSSIATRIWPWVRWNSIESSRTRPPSSLWSIRETARSVLFHIPLASMHLEFGIP